MKRAVKRGVVVAALACVIAATVLLALIAFQRSLPQGPVPPLPSEAAPRPTARVTPGQRWQLRVKTYNTIALRLVDYVPDPKETIKPHLQFDFVMSVEAAPSRHAGDRVIARRLFIPEARAPEDYRGRRCILEFDEGSGEAEGVRWPDWQGNGPEPRATVAVVGKEKCLYGDMNDVGNYFPLDWITNASDLAAVPNGKREAVEDFPNHRGSYVKTVEPTTVPADIHGGDGRVQDAVRVEYSIVRVGKVAYRVAQVWVPGEPWWRSFQRWQGDLTLEAFREQEE